MKQLLIIGSLIIGFSVPQEIFAADATAEIVKPTQLKKQPKNSAKSIADLKAEQSVTVTKRQGGWYQLDANESLSGWVRMLAVRFKKAPYRPGKSGLGATLSSIRSGHSGITATTGVRGLNSESIINAKADFKQLDKMIALAIKPTSAKKYARKGGLKSNKIAYWEKTK
jgi:hypothetical protein